MRIDIDELRSLIDGLEVYAMPGRIGDAQTLALRINALIEARIEEALKASRDPTPAEPK
jgi:hypothetical protein